MRPTIAAAACALALLAGCGGGDSDTALTPGDSAPPTVAPEPISSTDPSSDPSAAAGLTPVPSDRPHPHPKPLPTSSTAKGDALPMKQLLPEHLATDPYPASQLKTAYTGEVIVSCNGTEFPLDRILKPHTGDELSAAVKKAYDGTANPDRSWIVAIADEHHVLVMQEQKNLDYTEFEIWDAYFNKGRWSVDDDQYPGNDCEIHRALPGLTLANWTVRTAPKPGDTTVQLEIDEFACTDGKPAESRVQVPILEVTKDGVRVAIGYTPLKQAADAVCQDSLRSIYELKLPEPIGDRPIIDVGVYPQDERETP